MLINKTRLVLLTLLILGSTVTATGYLAHSLSAKDKRDKAPASKPQVSTKIGDAKRRGP